MFISRQAVLSLEDTTTPPPLSLPVTTAILPLNGDVVEKPILPVESTMIAVEVAVSVEGEILKRSAVALADPAKYMPRVVALPCSTESLAAGEVVPMPTEPSTSSPFVGAAV